MVLSLSGLFTCIAFYAVKVGYHTDVFLQGFILLSLSGLFTCIGIFYTVRVGYHTDVFLQWVIFLGLLGHGGIFLYSESGVSHLCFF